ncbi:MAG: zinc ribbon domain-containing protein [Lachnospiraceae bacterium]|nr:zinc ribbon domain-containing protein [Lachnospiraceae bacterium]
MLVVYGVKRKLKIDKSLGTQVCPNCGHTVDLSLAREKCYAHIYYIPVFPWTGMRMKACPNCGVVETLTSGQYKELKNS